MAQVERRHWDLALALSDLGNTPRPSVRVFFTVDSSQPMNIYPKRLLRGLISKSEKAFPKCYKL